MIAMSSFLSELQSLMIDDNERGVVYLQGWSWRDDLLFVLHADVEWWLASINFLFQLANPGEFHEAEEVEAAMGEDEIMVAEITGIEVITIVVTTVDEEEVTTAEMINHAGWITMKAGPSASMARQLELITEF